MARSAENTQWLSSDIGKAATQRALLLYSPAWMLAVAAVVLLRLFDSFTAGTYVLFGLSLAVPCAIFPAIYTRKTDAAIAIHQRHWFRVNVWIGILTFIGNYVFTHYFYDVLGASYTLPTGRWVLNEVPIVMFLMTQPYFCTYHVFAVAIMRRYSVHKLPLSYCASIIFFMAYATAFMETWSISAYPHYAFPDRMAMYKYGSVFYGLMFIVTYPMFLQFEQAKGWSLVKVIAHSLLANALVWILFEGWKQIIGPMAERGGLRPPA